MGIALIVPDISFAGANLGKVTLQGVVPLTGLAISGPDSVSGAGNAATYLPVFTPANTTQRGVTWSIVSGGTYASINSASGVLSVLQGASANSVTIRVTSTANASIFAEKTIAVTYSASTGPTHTGAAYFLPLEANSTPSEGSLSVQKENTTYSADGALFDASGEGIVYNLPSGVLGYAIAFSFKKLSGLGISTGNYFFQISNYNDSNENNGASLYTSANSNNPGSSSPADFTFASNAFTMNEWHRACFAIIGTSAYLYIDGVQVGSAHGGFSAGASKNYIIIGNNWRYRKSDGDRVFGGYIKDVAVWTSEIAQEDMEDFSTL